MISFFHVYAEQKNINAKKPGKGKGSFQRRRRAMFTLFRSGQTIWTEIHSDSVGKVAVYAVEYEKYAKLKNDGNFDQLKAMRSRLG